MRPFSLRLILTVFSAILVLSAGSLDAGWGDSKPKFKKTEQTEKNARAGSASSSANNSDRFLSYDEQKEKELDEARAAKKGVFIRFPWSKKEKEKEKEVADPFGNAQSDAPKYQNLEELGIPSKGSNATPEQTAQNDGTSSRAGSGFGSAPVIPPAGGSTNTSPTQTPAYQGVNPNTSPFEIASASQTDNSAVVLPDSLPTTLPDTLPSTLPDSLSAEGNGAVGKAVELPQVNDPIGSIQQNPQEAAAQAMQTPAQTPAQTPSQLSTQTPAQPSAQTAVQTPVQPANQPGTAESAEPAEAAATMRNDAILKQLPSLTVDSSKLGGEGIQYYEHGQVLAQVGSQVILAGDIVQAVDKIMQANKEKIPDQFWDLQREVLIRNFLEQSIEGKLIYCDVLRNVPAEGIKQNFELIDKVFEDQELPARMKKAGAEHREDYEKILAEEGSCIQKQKYLYREVVFCQQWLMKTLPQNPTVSYIEIKDYYDAHPKEFETPPEASWEELVVRKNRFYSRDEAYQEIVRIGSMVAVQNRPFEEVAKEFSQGATASNGGKCDPVKPGQLASKPLEEAIFSQPVGELSAKIIEDEKSFYIIRVLERKELVKHPLSEVQTKIQNTIKTNKINTAREEYLAKLRREIPVFTVFDGIPTPEERIKAEREAAMAASKAQGTKMW
ncbi:MAG: peptidylprolyl isomerase [Thermoguttaceae bacterium]|nr:peptidylprolyl isomerase [Thermoguttaceae bacterium]